MKILVQICFIESLRKQATFSVVGYETLESSRTCRMCRFRAAFGETANVFKRETVHHNRPHPG